MGPLTMEDLGVGKVEVHCFIWHCCKNPFLETFFKERKNFFRCRWCKTPFVFKKGSQNMGLGQHLICSFTQPLLQDSVKIWCSDLTGHEMSTILRPLGLLKGFCFCYCLRAEGVRKALGVLHQLVRLTDVWKAKPEYNPVTIYKTAITVLEIPEDLKAEWEMNNGWAKTGNHNSAMWRMGHTRDWCG